MFFASLVAALGGFLFGFDTAVISGAEKSVQEVFNLDGFWHGFTVAIALIGTVFGALFAGKPADVLGRKKCLIVIGILYAVSAAGSALAGTWVPFLFYRFIGGLGVGASSVVGPMYISEIAPAHLRGRLVALFQFQCGLRYPGVLLFKLPALHNRGECLEMDVRGGIFSGRAVFCPCPRHSQQSPLAYQERPD